MPATRRRRPLALLISSEVTNAGVKGGIGGRVEARSTVLIQLFPVIGLFQYVADFDFGHVLDFKPR